MATNRNTLVARSPAKINLFLHITGQRSDGYHTLETAFQFLDFADVLKFEIRKDDRIVRHDEHQFVLPKNDLIMQAAELLGKEFKLNNALGVSITVAKKIPPGCGMGGGSSNAATTLLALNRLWNLGLTRNDLLPLAVQLGADVPLFIYGKSCWASGIGDRFARFEPPQHWYCVCLPSVLVSTATVFSHFDLQHHRPSLPEKAILKKNIENGTAANELENVLEPITRALYPEVERALKIMSNHGDAKMNGSGCSVYLRCRCKDNAEQICAKLPAYLNCVVTRTLNDITGYVPENR